MVSKMYKMKVCLKVILVLNFKLILCQKTTSLKEETKCVDPYMVMNILNRRLQDLESKLPKEVYPWDCAADSAISEGVNTIRVAGAPSKQVYCDMTTDGGGWLVFQRRQDGSENFYRNWADYQRGFGSPDGEFWLGNDYLHYLTDQWHYELRIDLEDFEGHKVYAVYSYFAVSDAGDGYRLSVSGYSGTAGDSLAHHNDDQFSTLDVDNDSQTNNCAQLYKGAWWYSKHCHESNLNGRYHQGAHESLADGVNWKAYKGYNYSLKFTEMKIRPKK